MTDSRPLTLKYRPRTFKDVTGQRSARVVLSQMILTGKVPPAVLLHGQFGAGKAQPLDAQVLTPTGFRLMGDLRVGDPVIDPEGKPSEVTGVFPQGEQDIYRVTFSDGSSCESTADHLWPVLRPKNLGIRQSREYRLARNQVETGKRKCVLVHEISPLSRIQLPSNGRGGGNSWILDSELSPDLDFFQGSNLPADPYLLGLLLGDGMLHRGSILFGSEDPELVDACREAVSDLGISLVWSGDTRPNNSIWYRLVGKEEVSGNCIFSSKIHSLGPLKRGLCSQHYQSEKLKGNLEDWDFVGQAKNPLKVIVNSLGINCSSEHKFVPSSYKNSSAETRLAVLQGLLDTDGSATPGGAEFDSCSRQLRDDAVWLARSLGFRATDNGEGTDHSYFNVQHQEVREAKTRFRALIFRSPAMPELFRLQRKIDRGYRASVRWRDGVAARRFVSVELVRRAEAQCISVSADSRLYVTDDFIPTHNTSMARIVASALNCEKEDPTDRPCGDCQTCLNTADGKCSDVIEIDAASSGLAEDMRSLREAVRYAPSRRYRCVVLDEVHALSAKGFQTLLKVLEEPPANVIFLLATTNKDKVPETIVSRCFQCEFRRITVKEISARLAYIAQCEGFNLPDPLSLAIAARSSGALRDAVMLLDQCVLVGVQTPEQLVALMGDVDVELELIAALSRGQYPEAFECARRGLEALPSPSDLVSRLVDCLKRLLVLTLSEGSREAAPLTPPALETEIELAGHLDSARLVSAMRVVWEYYARVEPASDPFAAMDLIVVVLGETLSGRSAGGPIASSTTASAQTSLPNTSVTSPSSNPGLSLEEIMASAAAYTKGG